MFTFKLDAEPLGSVNDRLSDADFSLHAGLESDILEYLSQQIIQQFETAKEAATRSLEVAQEMMKAAEKSWEEAISDAEKSLEDARRVWESYERGVRGSCQSVIDDYLSEESRLQGNVDKARYDFHNSLCDARRVVEQAVQDRAAALAAAERDVESAKHDMDKAISDAEGKLVYAKDDLYKAFGDPQGAIDSAERGIQGLQSQIDDTKSTIDDYERAPWHAFWKKAAIPCLRGTVETVEASKAAASGVLDAARGVLTSAEYVSKLVAVESACRALDLAKSTGEASLSAAQGAIRGVDETSKLAVDQAKCTLEEAQTKGAEFVAFRTATAALEHFQNTHTATYEAAMETIEGLIESAAFVALNSAKAALEVARASKEVLKASKETLSLVEKATPAMLQQIANPESGQRAVEIKAIILSGTLRVVLDSDTDGGDARPLSATIKGYVWGVWFEIRAEFDPREHVRFITATFKQSVDHTYVLRHMC